MSRCTARLLVAFIVVATVGLVARPSAAQTSPTLTVTPETGLFGGDVVMLEGSGFAPGATVFFCQGVDDGSPDLNDCGGSIRSQTANETGAFAAPYIVQRLIIVSGVGAFDCAGASANCAIGAATLGTGGGIAVTPITFVSQPPLANNTVFGRVTDPAGDPVGGANVWGYRNSDVWVGLLSTVTDSNGQYAFEGVDDGTDWRLRVFHPSGSTLASEWFDNSTTRGAALAINLPVEGSREANVQLEQSGSIAGTASGPTGDPIAGVTVWAYAQESTWVGAYRTTTGADGAYLMSNMRPAALAYQIRFVPAAGPGLAIEWYDDVAKRAMASLLTVSAGPPLSPIDAQLEAVP
jgi:hypothetical protein